MGTRADPVLYSFRRCPYAMRARLALAVSGTRCELREVKLSAKPSAMLQASPKGTVPVLVLPGGAVIDESLDIMRWALAAADPEAWLLCEDAALIDRCDGRFKHDLDRYKYPERQGSEPLYHRARALDFLELLERRLEDTAQLCGTTRGMTDAAIMPFVRQFAAVDPEWFASLPLNRLQAWLEGHLASDLFATIMARWTPWVPGDDPLFAWAK
jgi:glutathione S-transferase